MKERFLSFAAMLGAACSYYLVDCECRVSTAGEYLKPVVLRNALIHFIDWIVSLVVITVPFVLIFKVLPSVSLKWNDVLIAAVLTALLFTGGSPYWRCISQKRFC